MMSFDHLDAKRWLIRILRQYANWKPGEIGWVPADVAQELVEIGVAEYV